MPLLQISLMNPIVTDYHKMSHVSRLNRGLSQINGGHGLNPRFPIAGNCYFPYGQVDSPTDIKRKMLQEMKAHFQSANHQYSNHTL